MIVIAAALLGVLAVPLAGGRLGALREVQLRLVGLLPAALVLQVLVLDVWHGAPRALLVTGHVVSYALIGVLVAANRQVPGLLVVAAGACLNGAVIALNGGTLPASATALRRAGIAPPPGRFVNSGLLAHPRLPWLGDVFAWPAPLPLHNVFSVGDVVIVAGVVWGAHRVCGSTRHRARRTAVAAPAVSDAA